MIVEVLCNGVVYMAMLRLNFQIYECLLCRKYSICNEMSRQGQCCSWVPFSVCHGDTGALDFEVSIAVCKLMWCGFLIFIRTKHISCLLS